MEQAPFPGDMRESGLVFGPCMAAVWTQKLGWVPGPRQHSQPGEGLGAVLGWGRDRVDTTPKVMGNRRL